MSTSDTISSKDRVDDHRRLGELAERHGSNRQEIKTAAIDVFAGLSERRQKQAVVRARQRYPLPYPRTGRGNRGTNPAPFAVAS